MGQISELLYGFWYSVLSTFGFEEMTIYQTGELKFGGVIYVINTNFLETTLNILVFITLILFFFSIYKIFKLIISRIAGC